MKFFFPFPYPYDAGTAVSIPITTALTDAWDDLTTISFVACATIPVLSRTPFGPSATSYSMNSEAAGVAAAADGGALSTGAQLGAAADNEVRVATFHG